MKIFSFVHHTEVVQINSLERISEHFDSEKLCSGFIAPKASAEGACIFSKLVTMERV